MPNIYLPILCFTIPIQIATTSYICFHLLAFVVEDKDCYTELFTYYRSRDRVLVLHTGNNPRITEMFMLPLSADAEPPAFVKSAIDCIPQRTDALLCILILSDISRSKPKPSSRPKDVPHFVDTSQEIFSEQEFVPPTSLDVLYSDDSYTSSAIPSESFSNPFAAKPVVAGGLPPISTSVPIVSSLGLSNGSVPGYFDASSASVMPQAAPVLSSEVTSFLEQFSMAQQQPTTSSQSYGGFPIGMTSAFSMPQSATTAQPSYMSTPAGFTAQSSLYQQPTSTSMMPTQTGMYSGVSSPMSIGRGAASYPVRGAGGTYLQQQQLQPQTHAQQQLYGMAGMGRAQQTTAAMGVGSYSHQGFGRGGTGVARGHFQQQPASMTAGSMPMGFGQQQQFPGHTPSFPTVAAVPNASPAMETPATSGHIHPSRLAMLSRGMN